MSIPRLIYGAPFPLKPDLDIAASHLYRTPQPSRVPPGRCGHPHTRRISRRRPLKSTSICMSLVICICGPSPLDWCSIRAWHGYFDSEWRRVVSRVSEPNHQRTAWRFATSPRMGVIRRPVATVSRYSAGDRGPSILSAIWASTRLPCYVPYGPISHGERSFRVEYHHPATGQNLFYLTTAHIRQKLKESIAALVLEAKYQTGILEKLCQ